VRIRLLALAIAVAVGVGYLASVEAMGLLPLMAWGSSLVVAVMAYRDPKGSIWESRDWVAAAGLLGVALLSRTIALESVPFGIHGDEADWALIALRLWRGESPLFAFLWQGYPGPSFVPYSVTLGLFGQNLFAVRLASGLIGSLAIPLLYLLGTQGFGRRAGAFSALFLLINVSNFHFSRMGLPNIEALPVALLGAIGVLAVIRRPGRLRMWAVLGLSVGLCAEVYLTALFWPVVAFVSLIPGVVIGLRRGQGHELLRGLGVATVVGLIAASPILVYSLHHPGVFGARGNSITIWSVEGRNHTANAFGFPVADFSAIVREQTRRSIESLYTRGDSSLQYGGRALLDPVAGTAFVLGLGSLLVRWRSSSVRLTLTWFVSALTLGAIILIDPPFAPRLVGLTPIVCLIGGVGLADLAHAQVSVQRGKPRPLVMAGLLAILVGGGFGFAAYFGPYRANHPNVGVTALAWYLRSVQGTRDIYFIGLGEPVDYVTLEFMAPDAHVRRWEIDQRLPPPPDHAEVTVLMPIDGPNATPAAARALEAYPSGRESFLDDAAGKPVIRVWDVTINSG